MRKIVRTLLAIIGLAVVVTFAIANRGPVEVSYWPLPFARTVPLYAVLLAGVLIGVVLGALAAWLSAHRRRVTHRKLRDRVSAFEYEAQQRHVAEERAAADAQKGRSLTAPAKAA